MKLKNSQYMILKNSIDPQFREYINNFFFFQVFRFSFQANNFLTDVIITVFFITRVQVFLFNV